MELKALFTNRAQFKVALEFIFMHSFYSTDGFIFTALRVIKANQGCNLKSLHSSQCLLTCIGIIFLKFWKITENLYYF